MVRTVYDLKEAELRSLLLTWKLSISGRKSDKLERLVEAMETQGLDPETEDMDKHVSAEETQTSSNAFATQTSSIAFATQTEGSGASGDAPSMHDLLRILNENISVLVDRKIKEDIDEIHNGLRSFEHGISQHIVEIKTQVKDLQDVRTMNAKPPLQPPLQPPTFDGTGSWQVFKKQFDAVAAENQWTGTRKGFWLSIALRGKAAEMLRTISIGSDNSYDMLVLKMEQRYGDEHLRYAYRTQLRARVQKPNESLQELESDVENMVYRAYPNAEPGFLEEIVADTFVNAIRDPYIKQMTILAEKKSSRDALAYALTVLGSTIASRNDYGSRQRQMGAFDPDTHGAEHHAETKHTLRDNPFRQEQGKEN